MSHPSLTNVLNIFYQAPSQLLSEKYKIFSQERTSQYDSLVVATYGNATLQLFRYARTRSIVQKWYADDDSTAGKLKEFWYFYQSPLSQWQALRISDELS